MLKFLQEAGLRFIGTEEGSKLAARIITGAINGGVRSIFTYDQVCLRCGKKTSSKSPLKKCVKCGWEFPF